MSITLFNPLLVYVRYRRKCKDIRKMLLLAINPPSHFVSVRYHSGGSLKLNARILHLAYMVYLKPKHNSLLARHIHNWHDMYKINMISEVHDPILLIIPLCLESLPYSLNPLLLTWKSLLWRGAIPVHSDPWLAVY